MAYASKMDMVVAYGQIEMVQITDIEEPYSGAINDDRLNAALNEATAIAEGYLRGRYQLPIAPVPEDLRRRVCDIARFLLHDDGATDAIKDRYDRAMSWLRDVAAGKVSLGATIAVTGAGGDTVLIDAPERVFGRGFWP